MHLRLGERVPLVEEYLELKVPLMLSNRAVTSGRLTVELLFPVLDFPFRPRGLYFVFRLIFWRKNPLVLSLGSNCGNNL